MDGSTATLVIAAAAVLVGLGVSLELFRVPRRATARRRHPSAAPPLAMSLSKVREQMWWRIDVPPGRPTTTIDIVTYRNAATSNDWDSVPITVPVEVQPGGWALLPSTVDDRSGTYELVVAWTLHGAGGDVTGSGSFVVQNGQGVVARPDTTAGRGWILAGTVAVVLLLVAGATVVWQLSSGSDPDETVAERSPATTSLAPAPSSPSTIERSTPTTSVVASAAPTLPGTSTAATTPPTSAGSTSTSTLPVGPEVVINGRVEDCRFGSDCLIAGFGIERFETQPQSYVCEFSDGSRVTFTFGGSGVTTACSQAGPSPAITIEVDGVRSDTITRDSVAAA